MLFVKTKKKRLPIKVNKVLYKLALDYDFCLITNIKLEIDGKEWKCSQLLFTNKFIYCINNRFFEANLIGDVNDSSWIFENNNPGTQLPKNPIKHNEKRSYILNKFLSGDSGDSNYVIPLTVYNNHIKIPESVKNDLTARTQICSVKELRNHILQYEEDHKDVPDIDRDILQREVIWINDINLEKGIKKKIVN